MSAPTDIIRGLLQTEKGARLAVHDQYLFEVAPGANKIQIRQAVEALFNVNVLKVNTLIGHGKWRRLQQRWGQRSDRKKAIVTLAQGQKIEFKG